MNVLDVAGFDNRGGTKYPFGFIVFTDETRLTYAALVTKDRDEWGLPADTEEHGLTETHIRLARTYVEGHLPLPAVAIPQYKAEQAARATASV